MLQGFCISIAASFVNQILIYIFEWRNWQKGQAIAFLVLFGLALGIAIHYHSQSTEISVVSSPKFFADEISKCKNMYYLSQNNDRITLASDVCQLKVKEKDILTLNLEEIVNEVKNLDFKYKELIQNQTPNGGFGL